MAKAAAMEISDSENEAVISSKNKSPNGKKMPEDDQSEEKVDDEGSDAGSEEGSEYEIESIISAKRVGAQGFTYLVSWKGYTAEHNSWVDEADAGNATDLISEYWEKNKKEKKARKSVDKSKATSKAGRKSDAGDTEAASVSAAKKRARSKAKKDSDVEEDSDSERPRTAKKPRKSTKKPSPASMDIDDDVGDMGKYMHQESWEKLIKKVDTVEMGDDNKLYVFFTLKADNERHRQTSEICKKRFPLHMLDFYEGHLRWKQVDDEGNDA